MQNKPTGTVTFLFTDIEGSTKLAQAYPEAWESLRKHHNEIVQFAIDVNHGYTFQIIGDAFCAAFATAGEALAAAVKMQIDLHNKDWGSTPVKVRAGIHTGSAEIQETSDYHGYAALSHVQRIMTAGHGGQTLISQATQELIQDELPQGITLRDMGEHRLKDLIRAEHIYQVDIPSLPVDYPALKTLDVQLNNLPMQLTLFIGREREIAAVTGLLRNPSVHLVTLTGAGGTGKTRLSLQVAAELLDEYEYGVWFVDLAPITDPDLVLPTIASTLKVRESAGMSMEQALYENLATRKLLLILDNFEQVVSAGPVIGKLLAAAPKVKLLTSSREVLHLRGEHDYPVPPLGLPEWSRKQTAAVLAQYEAVALFIQHAKAANPAFELNEENAASVAGICLKLDGLPLAIELAAARSRMLKPAVMLAKLNNKLDLLTGGARDLPQRQQTIRGAIDWSYELLEDAERVLFARLGIFVGGWTLESAESVCGTGLSTDVMAGLESLLDKSLIRQIEGGNNEMRFRMLETIREYALEKLTVSGELPEIQQALAKYIETVIDSTIAAKNGPQEVEWFVKLDDEMDNLRSAMDWGFANHKPGLILKTGKLYEYWDQRSFNIEPLGWLERGLDMGGGEPAADRAKAMVTVGNILVEMGNDQRARGLYESALALYRDLDDPNGIVICLNDIGNIAWHEKDFEEARQLYEQCLVNGRAPGSFGHAMTLNNLGSLARIRGDWQSAREYYLQSREICERLGAEAGVSYADLFLGMLALVQGKFDEAGTYFGSGLKASWTQANPLARRIFNIYPDYIDLLTDRLFNGQGKIDDALEAALEYLDQNHRIIEISYILEAKGRLEINLGQAERAAILFGAAWTQRQKEDYPLTEAERPGYEAVTASTREALGDGNFEKAFVLGASMTPKQMIQFALSKNT